ncbi:MAG: hypothetical protein IH956_01900, partial [Chloroflexi bacterium]|nr:hypothetical protein [Chloroflexota bacterium]
MDVKQVFSKMLTVANGVRLPARVRANRVAPALSDSWKERLGVGQSWAPLSYGEYYPRSALVYSAIKVRQDAVVRVPLRVYRRVPRGARAEVPGLSPDSGP